MTGSSAEPAWPWELVARYLTETCGWHERTPKLAAADAQRKASEYALTGGPWPPWPAVGALTSDEVRQLAELVRGEAAAEGRLHAGLEARDRAPRPPLPTTGAAPRIDADAWAIAARQEAEIR
jgi:hypothetical protein